uniref:Uncharacterized protein n=1 Tax=Anguilla anguilla TaxID=7936 RepID=A0A0E9VHT7_ANGAN
MLQPYRNHKPLGTVPIIWMDYM